MYHAITIDDLKLLFGFATVILATGGALIGFVNLVHFLCKKSTSMAATTNVQNQ
ncbi:hypothetical protein WOSG25_041460 [Weissella oryzae SG25]|uniref:Uncharacterized protein n=1 Tax=Weissella oryzae (strain DSM 25784 / JCM 18191 / LMG 30913 / SG25) TaxID=1329250 RepID=A0A069CSA4_WEIOS|nr:hypothetical protein [Weissella oryzae]GAK30705.1 hypothetical protein WOSG25_041460 [Weissella oryzae SG25]